MSVIDMLLDLFRDDSAQDELAADPAGYLATHGLEGLTAEDVLNAMPGLCGALPPEQAEAVRAVYGLDGPSGGGSASSAAASVHATLPPPPTPDPGGDPVEQVLQQLNYFTTVSNTTQQYFEDNDVINIDDRDTTVDQLVN